MDEAVLEGEAVDERLERRAGRTQRLRHVDFARAAFVEIAGRTDMRQDFAGRIVDRRSSPARHRGQAFAPGCERARAPAPQGFFCMPASIVSRMTSCPARRQAHDRPRAAPASASVAARRARLRSWRARSRRGDAAGRRHAVEHAVARRPRRLGKRSGRRGSGDCGSATSSAASPSVSRRGSLPK